MDNFIQSQDYQANQFNQEQQWDKQSFIFKVFKQVYSRGISLVQRLANLNYKKSGINKKIGQNKLKNESNNTLMSQLIQKESSEMNQNKNKRKNGKIIDLQNIGSYSLMKFSKIQKPKCQSIQQLYERVKNRQKNRNLSTQITSVNLQLKNFQRVNINEMLQNLKEKRKNHLQNIALKISREVFNIVSYKNKNSQNLSQYLKQQNQKINKRQQQTITKIRFQNKQKYHQKNPQILNKLIQIAQCDQKNQITQNQVQKISTRIQKKDKSDQKQQNFKLQELQKLQKSETDISTVYQSSHEEEIDDLNKKEKKSINQTKKQQIVFNNLQQTKYLQETPKKVYSPSIYEKQKVKTAKLNNPFLSQKSTSINAPKINLLDEITKKPQNIFSQNNNNPLNVFQFTFSKQSQSNPFLLGSIKPNNHIQHVQIIKNTQQQEKNKNLQYNPFMNNIKNNLIDNLNGATYPNNNNKFLLMNQQIDYSKPKIQQNKNFNSLNPYNSNSNLNNLFSVSTFSHQFQQTPKFFYKKESDNQSNKAIFESFLKPKQQPCTQSSLFNMSFDKNQRIKPNINNQKRRNKKQERIRG